MCFEHTCECLGCALHVRQTNISCRPGPCRCGALLMLESPHLEHPLFVTIGLRGVLDVSHLLPSATRGGGDHDLCSPYASTYHQHIVLEVMIGADVYKLVCVGGFTVQCDVCTPSSLMFIQVSRKGSVPSCSGSFVNLMLESRLLRWTVNSST